MQRKVWKRKLIAVAVNRLNRALPLKLRRSLV